MIMESKLQMERKYVDLAKRNQSMLSSLSSHIMLSPLGIQSPMAFTTKELYEKVVQSSHRAINQNEALNNQISQADQHIQTLSSNIASLKRQVEYLQEQIHNTNKSIKNRNNTRLNYSRIQKQSKQLQEELTKLQEKHKKQQQEYASLTFQINIISTANKSCQSETDQLKYSLSTRQMQHQSRIAQLDNELYRWKREVEK